MEKTFLTVAEAADYLNLSKSSIYKMVMNKTIPAYKPSGGRVLIKRTELDEWVVRSTVINMEGSV